jgi:hypothetical protein
MSKRTKTATVDVGLRVKEPMRARIERSAKDRGVSMNGEIVARLEATFSGEELFDKFFGGPEMRQMANLWAANFAQGARRGEGRQFDPETESYREGALAVLQALMVGMSTDAAALFLASAKSRFLARATNAQRRAKGE